MWRIGQGYDVHRLVAGRPLILGGVTIPYARGLVGHSDADVLIHALADALFGALALGDIGGHYPDTAAENKNLAGEVILTHAAGLVRGDGWEIGNIDSTLILEEPKLKPHIPAMRANLARILNLQPGQISVKAKTNEKLGYLGESEAIAAQVIVLLRQVA